MLAIDALVVSLMDGIRLSSYVDPVVSRKQLISCVSKLKCTISMASKFLHKSIASSRVTVGMLNVRRLMSALNALVLFVCMKNIENTSYRTKLLMFSMPYQIEWIIVQV